MADFLFEAGVVGVTTGVGGRGEDRVPITAGFGVVGVVAGVDVELVEGVAFRFPFDGDAAIGSNTSSEPDPDWCAFVFGRFALLVDSTRDFPLSLSLDTCFLASSPSFSLFLSSAVSMRVPDRKLTPEPEV